MENSKFYQSIESYLDGSLSPEDKEVFENQLLKDKDLREEVKAELAARRFMEIGRENILKEKFKDWDREMDETEEANIANIRGKAGAISFNKILLFSSAAVILILCLGYFWFRDDSIMDKQELLSFTQQEFAPAAAYFPGLNKGPETETQELEFLINESKYEELIALLSDLPQNLPQNDPLPITTSDSLYALALAYIHATPPTEDLEKGDDILHLILGRADDPQLLGWAQKQSVLVAIKQEDMSLAKERLEYIISETKDISLKADAQDFLNKLNL